MALDASGGAVGLLLSGLYLINAKPVYQGEFQIVLSQQKGGGGAADFLGRTWFAVLVGLAGGNANTSIATEVQILNSPSVLRPVFDAVKARKPPEIAKGMRFQGWAKGAITAEENGTAVLNVQFRDTDKLVLPITR